MSKIERLIEEIEQYISFAFANACCIISCSSINSFVWIVVWRNINSESVLLLGKYKQIEMN